MMKPEKILQSTVLDIVFENRNKEYGAYELRKNYNKRIYRALGATALVVGLFAVTQSFKVTHKNGRFVPEVKDMFLADLPVPKEEFKPKEEVKHQSIKQPKEIAQQQFSQPVITQEPITPVATVDQLNKSIISDVTKAGIDADPGILETPKSIGNSPVGEIAKPEAEPENAVLNFAETMPQFPGGKEAFIKFMQKNLRQPEDFDEGQKLTVIAKFIVDAEGNIVDIDIIQNGRKDLDEEVMRVVRKMPRWNPGMQNGRKVPVYFKVPVTFVGPE